MTWTSFHRRGDVLRDVIAAADARRDGVLPLDVDGVGAVFADELDLVGALQLSWHTRLMGRVERRLADQPMSPEDAVVAAWHDTCDQLGGIRLVLDASRAHPDERIRQPMAKATIKERLALAFAAGLGNLDDEASARVGARIEQRARATYSAMLAA